MPVYTLTILCAAALVVWTYHMDHYEREPWPAAIAAVAAGFSAMFFIGLADDFVLGWLALDNGQLIFKAAAIALIEEGGKLCTLLFLAQVLLRKHFNDPMDGLVYGRLAGVGMAVRESLLYLSFNPPTLQTLGMEIVRLFAHSLMAAFIGFAIGIGCRPNGPRQNYPRLVLLCLALSTTMHFGWDVVAYSRQTGLLAHIIPMWLMLIMLLMWSWFCSLAKARSKSIFEKTAPLH